MFTLSVLNNKGKEVGTMELDETVFDGTVNIALLHQVTVMYEANQRQGTANTKTRAHVSGGNSKPWRQKGTGRARVGSSRSPLWRKGGIVFGPHPRDYSYQVPRRMKTKALVSSLNSRLQDKLVTVLEGLSIPSGKTKDFSQVLTALKLTQKTLVVCDQPDALLLRAARNIANAQIMRWNDLNARDVLTHRALVFQKQALEQLTERLKKGVQ